MRRGDVMMATIDFTEGIGSKRRPVVVVQADCFNATTLDTVVAALTSNVSHTSLPNRFLIDPATPDGAQTGLRVPSVVRCDRLSTIAWSTVGKRLGRLSPSALVRLDACLKASLDLP